MQVKSFITITDYLGLYVFLSKMKYMKKIKMADFFQFLLINDVVAASLLLI